MTRNPLIRLTLAAGLALGSSVALAQGTTPGTTPTNPAPETMGTPKSGSSSMSSDSMSTGAGTTPTQAECDQMMADHKKSGSSMKMDDAMKTKMKQCHDLKSKKSDTMKSDSSKMN